MLEGKRKLLVPDTCTSGGCRENPCTIKFGQQPPLSQNNTKEGVHPVENCEGDRIEAEILANDLHGKPIGEDKGQTRGYGLPKTGAGTVTSEDEGVQALNVTQSMAVWVPIMATSVTAVKRQRLPACSATDKEDQTLILMFVNDMDSQWH
eukprot:Gb_06186 [translate_table: standard]